MSSSASVSQQLCLHCGLCCNGVLFKDVELQPGDDPIGLAALGLPLQNGKAKSQNLKIGFPQPCVALCSGNRCRIYAGRPSRCRQFECSLFKAVHAGKVKTTVALRTIRNARRRADRVRQLLDELGDGEAHIALSIRFKRMTRRLESAVPDEATADLYGQLTLAMHDLNALLRREFYPDPAD